MTPLARHLQRELLKPARERATYWQGGKTAQKLQRHLTAAQFFNIAAVFPLMQELYSSVGEKGDWGALSPTVFAPAPETWLETNGIAALLTPLNVHRDPPLAVPPSVWEAICRDGTGIQVDQVRLDGASSVGWLHGRLPGLYAVDTPGGAATLTWAISALAIINSPRIIAQTARTPHKGLAREMRHRRLPTPGKWYEIKLQVTKPRYIDDGEPHADQITGQRALHFCRRHLRICASGKLAYVTAHWRGNPEVGIRQSQYVVTP